MKNTEQSVYEMLNPPKKKAAVAAWLDTVTLVSM